MNDIATRNNLYFNQLMNIFFHPNSYFSLCVAKHLNREQLFEDGMGNGTSRIKRFFILKLIESRNAAEELLQIARLDDSIQIYDKLVTYVKDFDFCASEKTELKHSIACVCSFFLNQLDEVLKNQYVMDRLCDYLRIQDYTPAAFIARTDCDIPCQSSPAVSIDRFTVADNELLDHFFKEEIVHAIDIVRPYSNGAMKTATRETFYADWLSMAKEIKTVAMMNGQQEVEAVADRIYRLVNILAAFKASISDEIVQILKQGQHLIESITLVCQDPEDVMSTIKSFDSFITETESSLLNNDSPDTREDSADASAAEQDSNADEVICDEEGESRGIIQAKGADRLTEEFKIPGEDDPELLILIQEISNVNNKDTDVNGVSENLPSERSGDPESDFFAADRFDSSDLLHTGEQSLDDDVADDIDIKIFLEESAIYFKLSRDSITELIRDRYNETALENLELASSCLKSQTIKFGFEEISDIPRKIENLVTFSINKSIKLTPNVLETIQEAIQLLESANQESIYQNRSHIIHKLNLHLHELNRLKNEHDVIYPQVY